MREIVRWFLENAPSIAAGLLAIALVRVFVETCLHAVMARMVDRLKMLDKPLKEARDGGNAIEDVFPVLRRMAGPIALTLVTLLAFVVFSIWVFVSVWSVSATLPGLWGASIWWAGLSLGVAKAVHTWQWTRKVKVPDPRWKTRFLVVAAVVHLVFAAIYVVAPAGTVFHAAVTWVLVLCVNWTRRDRDDPGLAV